MRSRLSTDLQAHTVTPAASYVLKPNSNQLASFNIYEYHELFKGNSYTYYSLVTQERYSEY